jgi:flagellar basal body-associated protein FliL
MSGSNKSETPKTKTDELKWTAIIVIILLALLGGGYLYLRKSHPALLGGSA